MEVVTHTLVWNGEKYLHDLFHSFKEQTHKEVTHRIVDNGSTDGSVPYIHEHHSHSLVARNVKNLGFAPGHNQLFKFTFEKWAGQDLSKKAILLVNQDMILDPGLIEALSKALEADPTLGSVQPKIYRVFAPADGEEGVQSPVKSDVIDTTGLRLTRSWRLIDRGAGELDSGQYDQKQDIIGPCGALVMYRADALLDVLEEGEVFDGDFFAYREDCDLALRLRRRGWKSGFVPSAKAWHYRGMFGGEKRSWREKLSDRRGRRPFLAALSTRNQLLFLVKNLTCKDALLSLPFLVFEEGLRTLYSFLFEGETRRLLLQSPPFFFRAIKKRQKIMRSSRIPPGLIRSYLS
jgi:GT2 family glycosyltransferase